MSARNKQLIGDHYAAFWRGDEDALREQLAPDFADHGAPGTLVGIEPTLSYARVMRATFPDMKVTIDRAVSEGDHIAIHATWHGTQRGAFMGIAPTGKTITFSGMVFWRIADGRIAERWAVIDTASAMRQLQG